MKRGTHGIAVVRMVGVTDAGRIENVRDGSTVGITGTQPGVIFASDRPKKREVSATFFNLLHSMKRDARHSGY